METQAAILHNIFFVLFHIRKKSYAGLELEIMWEIFLFLVNYPFKGLFTTLRALSRDNMLSLYANRNIKIHRQEAYFNTLTIWTEILKLTPRSRAGAWDVRPSHRRPWFLLVLATTRPQTLYSACPSATCWKVCARDWGGHMTVCW